MLLEMEGFAMSDNPYYRELVDFRQTLQDWVTGATPAADEDKTFTRILGAAPNDGVYIRQDGQLILDGKENLNGFRQAHGAWPALKMWVEDFRLHWETDDLALVTFEEWGQMGDSEPDGLLSTVVFRKNPDTPFGVEWLHYQETALTETETES
jgi:hypothetical protein